jgi:hypothetical protein
VIFGFAIRFTTSGVSGNLRYRFYLDIEHDFKHEFFHDASQAAAPVFCVMAILAISFRASSLEMQVYSIPLKEIFDTACRLRILGFTRCRVMASSVSS